MDTTNPRPQVQRRCYHCGRLWDERHFPGGTNYCYACREERQVQRRQEEKAKILGRAFNVIATETARDASFFEAPHQVAHSLLTQLGGIDEFTKLWIEDFRELRNVPVHKRSHKVLLDHYKAMTNLVLEGYKTAPKRKNVDQMSDDELREDGERLLQAIAAEIRRIEEEQTELSDKGAGSPP